MNKIAIIHLYSMGFRNDEIVNFEISMANPSTIAELQKLELWRTKFEVASIAQEGMFDRHFLYTNLFQLTSEDIEAIEEGKRRDRLFDMELDGMVSGGVETPAVDATADVPVQNTASDTAPEPGLPPPPGEEPSGSPEQITAGKDPFKQVAAPNDILKPGHSNNHDQNKLPNLHVHATNTKKTALDPKRSYSELMRSIRAPFGEQTENESVELGIEEEVFNKRVNQLRKFAQELENVQSFRVANKKLLSD